MSGQFTIDGPTWGELYCPRDAGSYKLGNISFAMSKKPPWVNRLFTRWCLGWIWEDEPPDLREVHDG